MSLMRSTRVENNSLESPVLVLSHPSSLLLHVPTSVTSYSVRTLPEHSECRWLPLVLSYWVLNKPLSFTV